MSAPTSTPEPIAGLAETEPRPALSPRIRDVICVDARSLTQSPRHPNEKGDTP